jgi:hypothetical protein
VVQGSVDLQGQGALSFTFLPTELRPNVLALQTVLVIGNSASGYDITRGLASQIYSRRQAGETRLPKVYQSARSPPGLGIPFDAPDAPEYAKEVGLFPPIKKVDGRRIEFDNEEVVEDVDVMFVCPFHLTYLPWSPSALRS